MGLTEMIEGKLEEFRVNSEAKRAIQALRDEDARLRKQLGTLLKQREELFVTLAPRDELKRLAADQVEVIRMLWLQDHGASFINNFSPQLESVGGDISMRNVGSLIEVLRFDFETLCAIAPDVVTAGIHKLIDELEFKAGKTPTSVRKKALAEIDAQIASTEATHSDLIREAKAAGVSMDLLPDVDARRREEAARAEAARLATPRPGKKRGYR